ncbi:hypothetical protein D3C80_1414540 [compost metagenome]
MGRHHRTGHILKAFETNPVHQCLAPYHKACSDIAMATEVLGRRMHHQVSTQLQRTLQVGRAEGVVDHHLDVVLVRKCCHGGDIGHLHVRVGRGFEVDHPGPIADRSGHRLQIAHVDMPDLDPELADAMVQKGEGAAVQGPPHQYFITGTQQRPKGGSDRAHPRGQRQPRLPALQRSHALLQQGQGRVGNAAVEVPRLFAGKAGSAVFNSGEGIGRGLIHRRYQRATVGKRVVTVVDRSRGKP